MKRDENQNVEYKESWHDKYLEWICGYANAKGGTLYIGIEDDTKKPVGVKNANMLMEVIPNKIRDTMGVVADVTLLRKGGKDVIRIKVRRSTFPVSYHGDFHYRSGVLESESDYFRVTLPNLLYGFTDAQLVAAVDDSSYGVPKNGTKVSSTYHDAYHETYHEEAVLKTVDLKLLSVLSANGEMSAADLLQAMGIKYASDLRERYLRPLSRDGYIEFTLPNAKRSRHQKYRLTENGRAVLVR